jgi:nucleoside-diphosphate-sugar epimerase/predicted transcriptional regulator
MFIKFPKATQKTTLLEAVEILNQPNAPFLVILETEGQLSGTLNRHQLRKALLEDRDLKTPIEEVMNKNPIFAHEDSDIEKLSEQAGGYLPIIDEKNRVIKLFVSEQRCSKETTKPDSQVEKLIVSPEATIKKVINILDTTNMNIVLVVDNDKKFLGLVTEKDVREAIIQGQDIQCTVEEIMNRNPVTGVAGLSKKELVNLLDSRIELSCFKILDSERDLIKIPILDQENRLRDLMVRDELAVGKNLFFIDDDESVFKTKIKSILITGGAGYIGAHLSRKLLAKGYTVRLLDNLLYGDNPIRDLYDNPNFELIKGDVRHIEEVITAIRGMDAVVHLAAIVGDPACSLGPRLTIESNYLATKLLADVCKHHQINRFLFSSTCSVYGASKEKLSETSKLTPVSLYARSKIYSEDAILDIIDENFSPTILRLGTVYGLSPRPRFDLVLNIFVAHAIKEGVIHVDGGMQYRPMVHVADVADAFIACLEAPLDKVRGETFNIGSNAQNYRIGDLGQKVVEIISSARIEQSVSKIDARDYWVYFDKIKNALGFEPKLKIEDGIKELKQFFEEDPSRNYKDPQYYNHKILPTVVELESLTA